MKIILIGTVTDGVICDTTAKRKDSPVKIMVAGIETAAKEISYNEDLCEQDTSYNGCVLDSWTVYQTPYGLVERHTWARGAGLERSGRDFRLITATEIEVAQNRAIETAKAATEAAATLANLVGGAK